MTSAKSNTKSNVPAIRRAYEAFCKAFETMRRLDTKAAQAGSLSRATKAQTTAHNTWERALDRASDCAGVVMNARACSLEDMLLKIHVAGFIIDPVKRGSFAPAFKIGAASWQPLDFAPCDDMALIVSLRSDLNRFLLVAAASDDAELIALGAKFEPLLLPYVAAHVEWARKINAADAATEKRFSKVYDLNSPYHKALTEEHKRQGTQAAQNILSGQHRKMEKLAEKIVAAPARSPAGLRAKALVALWECMPEIADMRDFSYEREQALCDLLKASVDVSGLGDLFAAIRSQLKKT